MKATADGKWLCLAIHKYGKKFVITFFLLFSQTILSKYLLGDDFDLGPLLFSVLLTCFFPAIFTKRKLFLEVACYKITALIAMCWHFCCREEFAKRCMMENITDEKEHSEHTALGSILQKPVNFTKLF